MTKSKITASAPGKIHFLGEHTAVYGKPAILAAIDKRCYVELIPRDTSDIQISSKNFNKTITLSLDEILHVRDEAQEQWENYRETHDIEVLKAIVKYNIMYPVIAIGETFRYFDTLPESGFHITIDSHIPVGSGHGSSAAVAASVVGAVAKFLQAETSLDTIGKIAIKVEQKMHGNPSYGDVGAVVNGGLIWFQKKSPEQVLIKPLTFSVPKDISENMLIMQSGVPEESTGEMVHLVSDYRKSHAKLFEHILTDQEHLTYELCEALRAADEEEVLHVIRAGEKNLEKIGVVSDTAKSIMRAIEKSGGAAKICGAGGKTKGSGIILAYAKETTTMKQIAKKNELPYYTVALGGAGLQIQ